MWILLLGLTSGLVASSWAISVGEVKMRSCSHVGVFLIQGNERYTLTFDKAKELCEALGTTLASLEQVTTAYGKGMESCRYGWISDGNITIPRHVAKHLCAGNQTGIMTLPPLESKYDAYCYDQTDLSDKNCTFEIKDPELHKTTEDSKSQDLNHTDLPTDLPEHTNSTIIAVTELSHAIEQTNSTPSRFRDEVLDEITQTPSMTTEPEEQEEVTEENNLISSLESTGSGMGETTLTTTSEPTTEEMDTSEDHAMYGENISEIPTASTTEVKPLKPVQSVHPGGRMGPDMASSPEERDSSGSTKDWLVILLVVLAIVAIILVGALVVTRNRWCGRSQTLMITSKSSSEGNGTAASATSPQAQEREQEMVTLMNKEKIQENGNTEEFTVITLEESPEKNEQA